METTIFLRGTLPITITNEKLLRRINFVCQSYNHHRIRNNRPLVRTSELIESWLENTLAFAESQFGKYGERELL